MNRDTRLRSEIERRRGVALAAVLLVGMGIMLLALGVIHLVRSEVAGLGAAEDLEQSRLLGRSAIRAFADEHPAT